MIAKMWPNSIGKDLQGLGFICFASNTANDNSQSVLRCQYLKPIKTFILEDVCLGQAYQLFCSLFLALYCLGSSIIVNCPRTKCEDSFWLPSELKKEKKKSRVIGIGWSPAWDKPWLNVHRYHWQSYFKDLCPIGHWQSQFPMRVRLKMCAETLHESSSIRSSNNCSLFAKTNICCGFLTYV